MSDAEGTGSAQLRNLIQSLLPHASVTRRYRSQGHGLASVETTLVAFENPAACDFAVAVMRGSLAARFELEVVTTAHEYGPSHSLIINRHRVEIGTRRLARLADVDGDISRAVPTARKHLATIAGHWSAAERDMSTATPQTPPQMARWMLQLGIAAPTIGTIASGRPVYVHCTRTAQSLGGILSEGVIRCGADVPIRTPRFDPAGDRWSGRDTSVMLNVGYGRLVDNPQMLAAFVFAEPLVQAEITVHRRPEMWEAARFVLHYMTRQHAWFVGDVIETLRCHQNTSRWLELADYLAECVQARSVVLHDVGSALIARHQLEIVNRLLEQGPASSRLGLWFKKWRSRNRLTGGVNAMQEIRQVWQAGSAYRVPYMEPMPPARQDGTQLLVPGSLPLGDPSFVAVALSGSRLQEAQEALLNLPPVVVKRFHDLPIITPQGVTTLLALHRLARTDRLSRNP